MNFKQTILCLSLIFTLILSASPALLYADISTDGSVGAAQNLTGPDYAIPETLGTIKGDNLFHSFDKFSIKTQESATFTGSDSIKNVISRVTGGEKSEIDGTLRSNVGKADFYFINPSGVVFGQNAKVDVPAAFHVSTTDELKFQDGSSFKASKAAQSTLTQAAPESFGFLGTQSASIEVNGSTLEFKPESKVSLTSSKDITIKGTENKTKTGAETKQASLTSAGGEIELKAKGDLLLDNARVESRGNGGGKVTVKAGNVKLHNKSKIAADNTGEKNVDGNGVEIKADKELEIKQSSRIQSNIFGSGDSGTVKVEAQNMLIKQQEGEEFTGVFIEVEPEAEGNGKAIDVKVKDKLTIQGAAGIPSTTYGYGNTASVNVTTGELLIDGEGRAVPYRNSSFMAGISSEAGKISNGNANTVSVYVDHLLTMLNRCGISGSISGKGDAGNVIVKAENIKIDGQGNSNFTGIGSVANIGSEGKAGSVEITVSEYLELINGGEISSSTFAKGDAGNVKIISSNIKIDGQEVRGAGIFSSTNEKDSEGKAGTVEIIVAEFLELINGAEISSGTLSKGDAGSVKITASNIKIDGQGKYAGVFSNALAGSEGKAGTVEITAAEFLELINGAEISSGTLSKGDAGSVKITASNIKIDGQGKYAGVFSNALAGSEGNAGIVEITAANLLELLNGGEISSNATAKGNAGDVIINAGNMKVDGQKSEYYTRIGSNTFEGAEGNAGKVEITVAGLIELLNGAEILSATWSKGDAGTIIVNTGDMKVDGQGSHAGIFTNASTGSQGNGGTLLINVSGLFELLNGGIISSSTKSKGNAGVIIVKSGNIKIDNRGNENFTGVRNDALADSEGNAGKIEITAAGLIELLNDSEISSSTLAKGNAGTITIKSQNMKIDGQGNTTGIYSVAYANSEGKAGTIDLTISEMFELLNGGQILSSTLSKGDAGSLNIKSANMKIYREESIKDIFTGIASDVRGTDTEGNAGKVTINISGLLELLNGAQIASGTFGKGNADNVNITAGNMKIDGKGNVTGVFSSAESKSAGNAGKVEITVAGLLELLNGGIISSNTISKGNAGGVKINAANMRIIRHDNSDPTGVLSSTQDKNSEGNAGVVEITVTELLELLNGGEISSSTFAKGDAGSVKINAGNVKVDRQDSIKFTGIRSDAFTGSEGNAGTVSIIVNNLLELINGGQISSSTSSKGDGGNVKVNAGNIKINSQGSKYYTRIVTNAEKDSEGKAGDIEIAVAGLLELLNGGRITSDTYSKGNAGNLQVTADNIGLINNAQISSSTFSKGNAGSVTINSENMKIDGENSDYYVRVSSNAEKGSEGDAGDIKITISKLLEILNGGEITTDTSAKGNAGDIKVKAGNMKIDGQGTKYVNDIASRAKKGSEGNAGTIEVTVAGLLELLNGGQITSDTFAKGNAGNIVVNANNMKISGKGDSSLTGISSRAATGSGGNAGTIKITAANLLELINEAQISSNTESKGKAGNIFVNAGSMKIDGQGSDYYTRISSNAEKNSEGNAGTIEITAADLLELINGAEISSSTKSKGDAGNVKVNAGNIKIDGQGSTVYTRIATNAETGSEGKAGDIEIAAAGLFEIVNGGETTSNTSAKGNAGNVVVNAADIKIDGQGTKYFNGIASRANKDSQGYVGNISINADSVNLINGSEISIDAYQTLPEEKLADMPEQSITLNTKRLTVESESKITSESTQNVPASDININSDTIYLHDGLITTSVEGTNGDGGNININDEADPADILVMQNGFIQANSKAKGGTGGRITINADRLLKESDATLEIGGDEIQQFQAGSKRNIIQAAAPEGNPKNDDIKSPTVPINIGASIINADSKTAKPVEMAENYCRFIGTKKASRLTRGGRGGIPPMLSEPSSIFITDERLEEFLRYEEQKRKK
ncbi:MAG: filamentous hemagglutinin N-terminal domain-containing protein [Desulfamplus sp.]|nr:filamentous hemagglutinin N-terminal domain-containing protein [Desulfamplus sp.]